MYRRIKLVLTIAIAINQGSVAQQKMDELSRLIHVIDPTMTFYFGEEIYGFEYSINNSTDQILKVYTSYRAEIIYDVDADTIVKLESHNSQSLSYKDYSRAGKEPILYEEGLPPVYETILPNDSMVLGTLKLSMYYYLPPSKYRCIIRVPFADKKYAEVAVKFVVLPAIEPDYTIFKNAIKGTNNIGNTDFTKNTLIKFLQEEKDNIYYKTALYRALHSGKLGPRIKFQGDPHHHPETFLKMKMKLFLDSNIQDQIIKSDHHLITKINESLVATLKDQRINLFKNGEEKYAFINSYLKKMENKHPSYSYKLIDELNKSNVVKDSKRLINYSSIRAKNK